MKIKRIIIPLLLIILLASTIAFGTSVPLGPYYDDTYFDLSNSALILKIVPHEKGGLEADVSAYDGLIKITGGATSNLTIGIADDNIVEIDDADAAVDDYCKLTANGIVGRSYSEVKTDLGIDLTLYYLKTEIDTQGELETIWGVTLSTDAERNALTYSDVGAEQADAGLTSLAGLTYTSPSFIKVTATDTYAIRTYAEVKDDLDLEIGTDIQAFDNALNSISGLTYVSPSFIKLTGNDTYAVRTIAEVITDLALDSDDLSDVASIAMLDENEAVAGAWTVTGSIAGIDATELGYLDGITSDLQTQLNAKLETEVDPTVDSDSEIKAILVDEVTKTGAFTAGRIAKINNATGIIEQGTNTDTDVADAVTKKHAAGSDTTLGTLTADINMGTHKLTGLSVPSATGQSVRTTATITEANLEDAITKKHSQNTDTQFDFYNALASDHTWSGDKDTQPVGESVVFGDLLYFNWTDKEWKKTDADAEATVPGLRIALETKSDGQTCLMLVKGYIRDDSAFEFAGAMVYTSVTPGAMSSTAPTETGDQLQRVGVAKSADILFFSPSIDVGEI